MMDYALSLRPEYHQAVLDVVNYYGWKKIIYIYDSHDGTYINEIVYLYTTSIKKYSIVYILLPEVDHKQHGRGLRKKEVEGIRIGFFVFFYFF